MRKPVLKKHTLEVTSNKNGDKYNFWLGVGSFVNKGSIKIIEIREDGRAIIEFTVSRPVEERIECCIIRCEKKIEYPGDLEYLGYCGGYHFYGEKSF